MGDKEQSATSFGSLADSYDRVRPGPAPAAVDWLLPDGCAVAVDLAAGTGLFTRALEGRAGQVVAVEPDERMQDVLAARSPGLRVLDGRAEDIPLPDGCADAVLVSHAWHWFDPARAVPDLARSRVALEARAVRAEGTHMVRMPMRSWCWRADRLPRIPLSGG